jgi:hypothetical protein
MPNVRTLLRSFAGGEISPEMYGRIDDEKYQSGAAILRNFIAKAQGPAENRPGFSYVASVKTPAVKTRLIPFVKSTTDSCVIELGAGYFRFFTNGAPILNSLGTAPYEVANTYTAAELFDIHYVQSNDVITLVHPNHRPATLSRTSTSPLTWVLADISIIPSIAPPSSVAVIDNPPANDPGPTKYTYSYVVTSIAEDGISESAPSLVASVASNLNETGRTVNITWPAVSGASRYYVYKLQTGIYGYIGEVPQSAGTLSITDENIAPDMSITPPQYDDVFNLASSIASVNVTAGGSNYGTTRGVITNTVVTVTVKEASSIGPAANPTFSIIDGTGSGSGADITTIPVHYDIATSSIFGQRTYTCTMTFSSGGLSYATPYIRMVHRSVTYNGPYSTETISIPGLSVNPLIPVIEVIDTAGSGTGAVLTPVLSGGTSGSITSVTVTNGGAGYISPQISVKSALGGSGATFTLNLSAPTNGDYPGAVSYFEQRKCFAGSTDHPAQIWMTKSGTENNMSYSLPVRDDDRISFQVAAREANTIRHIVPLTQLLLLTSSAEWRVSSTNSDVLTPSTISVRPQSYIGASNVQPSIINNTLVYCAARGGHVRECGYNWQAQGFITGDLSLRATHLFDNLQIMDMCYSKSPQPLLWFVSSNGNLLGLTYIPEQNVGAWHHHDTDGQFETCTVVPEGDNDILYVIVKRTLPSGSVVRYVERMQSRLFETQSDAFFVDSGVKVVNAGTPPATTTINLSWLIGKTVSILADGAVLPQQVVPASGQITLTRPYSKIIVGLPYVSDLKTLPLALQVDAGYAQGRMKNVNKVWMRVYRSSGIFIGPDEDNLTEAKQRTTEPYGSPPSLKSEEVLVVITPTWADSGAVFVRQEDPLPLTIVNMTMEVALGA